MRLIIAEKPSVALDLARALAGGTEVRRQDGYVEIPGQCIVTWGHGHLAELAPPEHYHPEWRGWTWEALPMLPERFEIVPRPQAAAQLRTIARLARRPAVTAVVAATDADREGELIWRWIWRLAGVAEKPAFRLWLSENTAPAIRAAFARLRPAQDYDPLAAAAEARAQADWVVGLNATRAFSLRHGRPGQPLSVGRVQTPTLRLLVDRDRAIEAHTPTPYWRVEAEIRAGEDVYRGIWWGGAGEHPDRLPSEAAAQAVAAQVPPGTPGRIASLERKRIAVSPPLPFSLTDLQREANRRLGLTAQEALDAAQALYEAHLTSYPRTEARHITGAIAATLPQRLAGLREAGYADLVAAAQANQDAWQRVVDDAKVAEAGHYAILPTGQAPPADLPERERAVYDLICRRCLAALLPAGQDERTTVWTEAGGQRFRTAGTAVVEAGWRAALPPQHGEDGQDANEADEGDIPPGLQQGQAVTVAAVATPRRETKPPARLTDASLLSLMEKHGLGTPATRARIVETLLARGYMERQKKTLVSTEKGRRLLAVLPPELQSPDLTGQWENRLERIARGEEAAAAFLADIREHTKRLVALARGQAAQSIAADLGPCPLCHAGRVIEGQKAWGCSRWREGCRFTIWKAVAGKRLTASQAKALLQKGETPVIKGFQSKSGKSFDAKLRLTPEGKVEFVFDTRPAKGGATMRRA